MTSELNKNTVYAYEEESILQKVVGENVNLEVALKDKIKKCQKMLDDARSEFFNDCQEDMRIIEEACAYDEMDYQKIRYCAVNIRGLAKIFGFMMIENICSNIINNCTASIYGEDKKEKIIIKLAELLKTSIDQKVGLENAELEIVLHNKIKRILKS